MHFRRTLTLLFFALIGFASSTQALAQESALPSLGNASSSTISLNKERELGSAWLRSLRQHVQTYEQPVVEEYLEQLVYSLAPNSDVTDRDFRFVILDSPELNAFAVPGSVVGINAGLFIHANTEQEFASVLAHELAHLSQRHFARRLEKQELSTPLTLAGVLASVIIAATTGAEAGIATLASTQAMSVEKALSYSRQNEEEADRIGIATLYDSHYNPRAMPIMFERMLRQARLQGSTPPEYLSTHPLSENRVADTRNRAEQYPINTYKDRLLYHICKTIVTVDYAETREAAANYFASQIKQSHAKDLSILEFGLAYAELPSKPENSLKLFESLHQRFPETLAIIAFLAEAEFLSGRKGDAIARLTKQLEYYPNNYTFSLLLSEMLEQEGQYQAAADILIALSRSHKENPLIWYTLAELYGQVGNIIALHQARAEFFTLTARFDQAIEQLQLGIKKAKKGSRLASIMQDQLDTAYYLKENPGF